MSSTVEDVERYLINARVLEEYWMSNGWDALVLEEETVNNKVLDVFPLIDIDISVTITIKLPNKSYSVPLKDVSPINVNDCLVIGVNDLYSDWEEKIRKNLGEIVWETTTIINGAQWIEVKYIGEDNNFRVVRLKASSVIGCIPSVD